ncbi:PREDICTED: uncharacterized protein LOC108757208 isoform X2 [Trachymyrmex septentrionalis]|uniref:uncharacterized protein LOC108757208 isoform X2 n=1 Tax=Trachymyrmex septentrionalis TaxID=34720 RepID=UPI00084F2AB5|nr:PREDICTED: uncharacterized protein LOC108757208 isoform X2 [Trachymyrmex septentrionalis]
MSVCKQYVNIFLIYSQKNKYNPLWQQSWQYAKSICSKKNIIDYNRRSVSKTPKHYGVRKKICFLNIQRTSSSTQKKLAERKLSLWEYVFGPKKSSKNPCAHQLTNCQEQACSKNLRYQMASRNVIYIDLIKSKNTRFTEPQPKPPPSYKLPRAVLLNKAIIEGFPKDDKTCEGKTVTPTTPRKPYEEMKPDSNSLNTKRTTDQHQKNIRSKNTKSYPPTYEKFRMSMIPVSDSAKARDITAKILRQAMAQEEPQMHSRIEQFKILTKEMSKSNNMRHK